MSGSDLALSPKQSSYVGSEPPSKRARLEAALDAKEHSHAPSSKVDGNTPPVPASDVEDDDPYFIDATASANEHKASDLYLDTVRHHACSTPDTPLSLAD
jgi:U4/U6.U5 tri-snRNP-associated protein 2